MTRHDPSRAMRVVNAIADYTAIYGHAPSVREIAVRTSLASPASVHYYLTKLREQGLIQGSGRSLRVVPLTFEGICERPGCGKALTTRRIAYNARWCSPSCATIAAHVRRWLVASGRPQLIEVLGL